LVDFGNSRLKLSALRDGHIVRLATVARGEVTAKALGVLLDEHGRGAGAAVVACCARAGDEVLVGSVAGKNLIIVSAGRSPVSFHYTSGSPGADRLANAAALPAIYPGRAAMAVDFGTATHTEVVNAAGEFLGGVILPGLSTKLDSLTARTAGRLPTVDLGGEIAAIANSTDGAIRAGVVLGTVGAVVELVRRTRETLGLGDLPVVLTGGGLATVDALLPADWLREPDLTAMGLAEAGRLLRKQGDFL